MYDVVEGNVHRDIRRNRSAAGIQGLFSGRRRASMFVRLAYRLQTFDSESTENVHDLTPHIRNRESSQWALRVRQPCQYRVDPAAAFRPVCERPTVDGKSRERGVQVEALAP